MGPSYLVYFRTHRGGCGIEFDAALTEFLLVARGLPIADLEPFEARMRLGFRVPETRQQSLVEVMPLLGYSEALVRLDREPGAGRGRVANAGLRRKRWLVGEQRMGDDIVRFAELWSADEEARQQLAPHRRRFRFMYPEGVRVGRGSRGGRRLSSCDAKLLVNLSQTAAGERLLDPFAGIGGIVLEAARRGITVLCGDIEEALRIGLAQASGGRAAIWDARALPLPGECVDAIVTEPPYAARRRAAVAAAMGEITRCLRPGGRLVALMSRALSRAVLPAVDEHGLRLEHDFPVRRQGFVARAACWIKE
jgi:SAM-dependent methyltransferase